MKPEDILKWAQLGAQLVNVLGVPIATVIKLYREQGVPEQQLVELERLWTGMVSTIEARIAELQKA